MARILKPQTIRSQLHEFFLKDCLYFWSIVFCCILFSLTIFIQYKQENQYLTMLNLFYNDLEHADSLLYTYLLHPTSENEELYLSAQSQAESSFDEVSRIYVDEIFSQDLRDVGRIFSHYQTNSRKLLGIARTVSWSSLSSGLYEENQQMLDMINRNFQTLYSRLLDQGVKNSDRVLSQMKLYGLLLLVFFLLQFYAWKFQTKTLSSSLLLPIRQFTEHVRQFKHDGATKADPVEFSGNTSEEFQEWALVYNEMIRKLQQQEQMRYQLLQSQINPHFLFNTLNMIVQSAHLNDDWETADLIGYTASLLRYSLDFSNRVVPLSKELDELGNYVCLQEKRFGKRFHFIFDLDEDFHSILVPSLILQPLVENAISHGLGTCMEDGRIEIHTHGDLLQKTVAISVTDNGVGMDETTKQQVLLDMISEQPQAGIGIRNVYQRLQIYFHGRARMTIESAPSAGTSVQMILPWEGNTHVQHINCR